MTAKIHVLVSGLCLLLLSCGVAQADFELTILHTNDIHSYFDAETKEGEACTDGGMETQGCSGGIARLATAINRARAADENVILLDAGDMAHGSEYDSYFKGLFAAELMNALEYDAMTPGNHEFDEGVDVLIGFLEATSFPLLAANMDTSSYPRLSDELPRSVVLQRGGESIAVIGVTMPDMYERSNPGTDLRFFDPTKAVQDEVDRLTAAGINKVILLSHLGYYPDRRLAQTLRDVDIIVGGHSHVLLSNIAENADGPSPDFINDIAIVQAGKYGKYLGYSKLRFDDIGRLVSVSGDPVFLGEDIPEDKAVAARLAEARDEVARLREQPTARVTEFVDGERDSCRRGECSAGNLITDAMLASQKERGAQIALHYSGAINASVEAGGVTYQDVRDVLRYGYAMSRFQATGEQIAAALEHGVSRYENTWDRFLQVSGLRFSFNPDASAGKRVVQILVAEAGAYVPLLPEKTYTVVTSTTMRQGRLGYDMFADAAYAYDHGQFIWDVVRDYLVANSPYTPRLDGRIEKLD